MYFNNKKQPKCVLYLFNSEQVKLFSFKPKKFFMSTIPNKAFLFLLCLFLHGEFISFFNLRLSNLLYPEKSKNSPQIPSQRQFLALSLQKPPQEVVKNFQFSDVRSKDVFFVLYKPSQEIHNITSRNALTLINPDKPTKIIIHGWKDNAFKEWIKKMASLYNRKGYNVIAPDWSRNATGEYLYAARNSRGVGFVIGTFLLEIASKRSDFLKTVHLIGLSLGSHVAAFAGKRVRGNGRIVDRITGLDVAAPLFEYPQIERRIPKLWRSDAVFVDLIHTSVGLYGVSGDYGHVDFYVNRGGPIQPGCENIDPIRALSCSHQKAHQYFTKTIEEPRKYQGISCPSAYLDTLGSCEGNPMAFMGEEVCRHIRGPYYIKM